MSGRRRISAGVLLTVVVVFSGCATEAPESRPPTAGSAVSMPSSSVLTSPSTSAGARSSTTNSTTTSSSTTTTVLCPAVEFLVLGNSTDYWPNFEVGVDAPTDDAWPAILETLLETSLPTIDVSVENGSVLGAGFDIGLYGVTSMIEQVDALAATHDGSAVVLVVAPSVVDLQLRSLDVDASYEAFTRLYGRATSAFASVVVLPMNPVAEGADRAVAQAVADFNRRLVASGLIGPDDRSPLLSADGLFGRPEFYDDFDDGRLDTAGPDPDGLHPDVDGHAAIADSLVADMAELVRTVCP